MTVPAGVRESWFDGLRSALMRMIGCTSDCFEPVMEGDLSMMLLHIEGEVSCFAVSGDTPMEDYKAAYGLFKRINGNRQKEWSKLDLSFVVCHDGSVRGFDAFFNEISTDVYFCRKYVVVIGPGMDADLEKLHFVPLERSSVSVSLRPLSAQGLLERDGVHEDLARAVVLPHQRGDDLLIADCLSGVFGEPEIRSVAVKEPSRVRDGVLKSSIRAKEIVIENFRAYRGRRVFSVDADVVVLYGPNGLGKTSFFDAIDFLATGGNGRMGDEVFRRAAKHLDASENGCSVTMTVSTQDGDRVYRRDLHSLEKCQVDGTSLRSLDALLALTGNTGEGFERRIEPLEQSFRATHLFGQDYQDLAPDFKTTAKLKTETVSRMLALQDYVRGLQKLVSLMGGLGARIRRAGEVTRRVRLELDEYSKQVDEIEKTERREGFPGDAGQEVVLSALHRQITEGGGIALEPPGSDARGTLRSWRASIEASYRQAQVDQERAAKVLAGLSGFRAAQKQLEEEAIAGRSLAVAMEKHGEELKAARTALGSSRGRLSAGVARESQLVAAWEVVQWQQQAIGRRMVLAAELEEVSARIGEQSPAELLAKSEKTKADEVVESLGRKVLSGETAVKRLSREARLAAELLAKALGWTKARSRLAELTVKRRSASKEVKRLRALVLSRKKDVRDEKLHHDELLAAAKQQKDDSQDLRILLDSLGSHVVGCSCPACGQAYSSKLVVLAKIEAQKRTLGVTAEKVALELKKVQGRLGELQELVRSSEAQLQGREAAVETLSEEAVSLKDEIDGYVALAKELHLGVVGRKVPAGIPALRGALESKWGEAKEALRKSRDALKAASEVATEKGALQRSLSEQVRGWRDRAQRLAAEIEGLKAEASERAISLEETVESMKTRSAEVASQLGALRGALAEERELCQRAEEAVQALEKLGAELKNQHTRVSQSMASARSVIAAFENAVASLALSEVVSEENLARYSEEKRGSVQRLARWRDEVVRVEVGFEAREQSAMAVRLKAKRDQLAQEWQNSDREEAVLQAWLKYLGLLSSELERTRDAAVGGYVGGYGRQASVIQKRLRAVYGFGDIMLRAESGEIFAEVKHAATRLIPTDFFSASQEQILILSLFLTAAITQNWSAFSPLLMDDPVMHFDDLNAYSFVDLINGLVRAERGRRQFIISTCDERLFQLMRHKLSSRGSKVIIHEFRAIGEKGPEVVSEVLEANG